jgi:hypothetical protein
MKKKRVSVELSVAELIPEGWYHRPDLLPLEEVIGVSGDSACNIGD